MSISNLKNVIADWEIMMNRLRLIVFAIALIAMNASVYAHPPETQNASGRQIPTFVLTFSLSEFERQCDGRLVDDFKLDSSRSYRWVLVVTDEQIAIKNQWLSVLRSCRLLIISEQMASHDGRPLSLWIMKD